MRIAIAVSHPIQHFCPQYISFEKIEDIRCKIFFASTLGYKKYVDPSFKQEISWDNLHLDKFEHCFLNGEVIIPSDKKLDAVSVEDELREYKPDVIITYGYWQKLQRRVYRWAVKHHIKLVYISDSELRHKSNIVKKVVKFIFIKKYFSKIDLFLSVGDANEDFYKHYGVNPAQIIRMHFPIDIYLYEKSYNSREFLREQIRNRYLIGKEEIVASVVGKLISRKRQDIIIKAMELMEMEGIYMHLFIIGSGERLKYLRKKAQNLKISKVHFTGFIKVQDLPGFYAASDFYIHPSTFEPHSIAVSEAIYMGCPVIVSDKCGSYGKSDDVQEGKNGFVFDSENVEELIDAMRLLIKNSQIRKNFSEYSHSISKKFQQCAHSTVIKEIKAQFLKKL